MKRVLISASSVYSSLDDNKILTNRARGIWALNLAETLADKGYKVTLLIPDTLQGWEEYLTPNTTILRHKGYHEYARICEEEAPKQDVAILAAAVLNFIPQFPVKGKMSTAGMKEGDVINIPFILAPRVINKMKVWNPKLTLIGCKLLSGATHEELIEAAYHVVLDAKCNAVVANDMKSLKTKHIVYQDRSVQTFDVRLADFGDTIRAIIDDEHYGTKLDPRAIEQYPYPDVPQKFDSLVNQHRARFIKRINGSDRVFGAVAVRASPIAWMVSPREKGEMFSCQDATYVCRPKNRTVIAWPHKASLNAPLLIWFGDSFDHWAVLHFHEQIPGLPTLPYAPPGTVRDNDREITEAMRNGFNIEGHGCVLPAE